MREGIRTGVLVRSFFLVILFSTIFGLACCGSYSGSKNPPPPTSVTVSPASPDVTVGTGTEDFTATVGNDYLNRGVNWSLSGAGCSGTACGTLTDSTSSSVTYHAPAAVPNPPTVTLTATSINSASKFGTATITIEAAAAAHAAVSLTMTDMPPAGATILSFEVTVTNAVLNPGNVDLLAGRGPVHVELRQLETESAFLNTANVEPGTFSSLSLTFANPELTLKNDSAAILAGCSIGRACQSKPAGTLTATVNFPGAGLIVQAGSPAGIQVDVNPTSVLTGSLGADFTASGGVSVKEMVMKLGGELDEIEGLQGTVQALDAMNQKFTLHTSRGDFPIARNGKTEFELECAANSFSCLMNGVVVNVDVKLMAGGAFAASKVEFEDAAEDFEIEGVVFQIDDGTHFEMVALNSLGSAEVPDGTPVVVSLDNSGFQVKAEGLAVPSVQKGDFESAADTSQLIAGQMVQVRVKGGVSQGPPLSVATNRVRLRMSQLTGSVAVGSVAAPNFSVGFLPALFVNAGTTTVHVQTSDKTDLNGAASVAGLSNGSSVSLRGLLFKNGGSPPELIAKKVRVR
jgi:Domain of unknown function (DUF5666)